MSAMIPSSDVLFEQRGALGLITLNRPQALNALTRDMCLAMLARLAAWQSDDSVKNIAIRGAGDKAFCAGGDVLGLHEAGLAGSSHWNHFFADEYRLDHAIHSCNKPYVALLNGITMGGGVGVSINGRYRVAGERFTFAMPETGIGLIPDVGATWFLPRLPGHIGLYLGLTGERLKTPDALAIGLVTHFVPSERHGALIDALAAGDHEADAVLGAFAAPCDPPTLPGRQGEIDAHFSADSVEAIMASLSMGSDWAVGVRDALLRMSPTSLKLAHHSIFAGAADDFAACLRREYRIVSAIRHGHDFYEGVRAQLIDKDRKPVWKPAALGDVTPEMLAGYLVQPTSGDLLVS
jgi:enoyl-CoA hydratase